MVYGIIVAGGIGNRMGAEIPKQFLMLQDRPIIIYSILSMLASEEVDSVLVLTPADWVEYTEQLINQYCRDYHNKKLAVLAGGEVRNETIMNAINYIEKEGNLSDDTIIVTHDAVRPFITDRMIADNIAAVRSCGAAATVIAATDTIICSGNGETIDSVPDRAAMYQAQTPQSFYAVELRDIYGTLSDEEKSVLTDATRIYTLNGRPVRLVNGERNNIKITYPQDILIAQAMMSGDEQKGK